MLRLAGRHHVHEHRETARLQDAAHPGEAGGEIGPMMGAVAAGDDIETGVLERQRLGPPAPRDDRAQPACRGRLANGGQHRVGEVVGDHFARERRDGERDMPAAAAEIEDPAARPRRDECREPVEVGSHRMVPAFDIGLRPRSELRGDAGVVGVAFRGDGHRLSSLLLRTFFPNPYPSPRGAREASVSKGGTFEEGESGNGSIPWLLSKGRFYSAGRTASASPLLEPVSVPP